MADDLLDGYDDDIFAEDGDFEEEATAGEGSNRFFIYGMVGMGLFLLCMGVAFAMWVMVLNPQMQARQREENAGIMATNEAILVAQAATSTAQAQPTHTPQPTETPTITPTPTPVVGPTATPTPVPTVEVGENGDTTPEPTATPVTTESRRTPTPVPSPTPTRTPVAGSSTGTGTSTELSETGFVDILLIGAAMLLLGVLFAARRLRKA